MADRHLVSYRHSTNVRSKSVRQRASRHVFRALSLGAPRMTERIVERIFFTPGAYALSAEEARRLGEGRPFHVRVHGRRICGWRWGDGPGVLLVHGWNGRGIQFHRFIDPLVRAGFSAVAVDGPAHGDSEGRSTSYFEFTDAVRALIEPGRGLGIRGIVAHSFGAAAVVNGLVSQKADQKAVLLAPALRVRDLLYDAFDRHGVPPGVYENIVAAYESRFGYSLERDDPHRRLDELRSPVLVIHDRSDSVIAYGDSLAACRRAGQMSLLTTTGLGHRKILTDGGVVEAAVSHLLDSHGARHEAAPPDAPNVRSAGPGETPGGGIAADPVDRVIERYRESGDDDRLHLFLLHRGLRERFGEIERDGLQAAGVVSRGGAA